MEGKDLWIIRLNLVTVYYLILDNFLLEHFRDFKNFHPMVLQ